MSLQELQKIPWYWYGRFRTGRGARARPGQLQNDSLTEGCYSSDVLTSFALAAFGMTTKIPVKAFSYTRESAKPTVHEADNGSGSLLHREFCSKCGTGILEYGAAAAHEFRYVMTGTLEDPGSLPPKGEFFCLHREKWMPEVPGIFHKNMIKE
ncbi:hypothetical protein XPA_001478 [Xanthoria parietina]